MDNYSHSGPKARSKGIDPIIKDEVLPDTQGYKNNGEVVSPGTYTLPVTASVFNALYLSGGPNNIGSFRNIQIIRDNNIYKTIDIAKYQ